MRVNGNLTGVLKKIQIDRSYNDFLEAITLYRAKENKLYKEAGLTWEEFCETCGIERRTADRIINDIKPIVVKFSDTMSDFLGLKLNEIRMLGRSVSDNVTRIKDGYIEYEGERFSFNKNSIKELIKKLEASYEERLVEQKRQAEKEKAEAERQLRIARTHIGHLEEQLREVQDLIPQGRELTESEKRIYVAKEVFKQLQRIIEAIPYDSKLYEKPSIPAQYEGLLNEIKRWIEIEIEKWNMHRRGDYGEGLQRAI
jgi:SMC interacting uncharacterized protein involved in chromosome segregation